MANNDNESMDRLNSYWDDIARGTSVQPDAADEQLAVTIGQLQTLAEVPTPDPAFSSQLWQHLTVETKAPETPKEGVPGWRRLLSFLSGSGGGMPSLARLGIAALVIILVFAGSTLLGRKPLATPTVIAFEPDLARGVPVQSPVTIQFNTAMNRTSVEGAFKVDPVVPGKLSWEGNTLVFTPTGSGYKRGTMYTVTIEPSARSEQNQSLQSAFKANFMAAENLSVSAVQPFKDSTEVDTDSVISVQFNNPVAALTTLDTVRLNPLVITPTVEGEGKWMTNSVYMFRPTKGLLPATQYTATVKGGITDSTGSTLTSDYTWSFRTWAPNTTAVFPWPDSKFVWISAPITGTFNQPVDRASLQSKFHLAGDDGRDIPGSFSWSGDETFAFTPGSPLKQNARYRVRIDAGVAGTRGNLGMAKEVTWSFTTVDRPRIVSIRPADGSQVNAFSQIEIIFNQPMDKKSVIDNLEIIPKPTGVYSYWLESDARLTINGVTNEPSKHYSIAVKSGAVDRFGQRLAEGKQVALETLPTPPSVILRAPAGTVSVSPNNPSFAIIEAVNVETTRLTLAAIDKATFLKYDANPSYRHQDSGGQVLSQKTIPTGGNLNERKIISTTLSLEEGQTSLPPGLYVVKTQFGDSGNWSNSIIAVSSQAVTLKTTSDEALVWVVDQVTGQPVQEAVVTLMNQTMKTGDPSQVLATGKTDANGLFYTKLADVKADSQIYAFSEKDGDIGVASSSYSWSSGISSYNFNLPNRFSGPKYAVALYTDRPIYRPGDKVYFKGVARSDDDGKFSLVPANKPLAISIRDAQYRIVYSQTLSLNNYGSFDGEMALGQDAPTGNFSIQASFDGDFLQPKPEMETYYASFLVAEYRKPDFEIKVASDKQEYIQGDSISVTVKASYFFGAPLADAKVTWQVLQKPYTFNGPKDVVDGPYSFSDYEYRGFGPDFSPGPKPIATGEGKTDANGNLTFRLRADIAKETMGQTFTFEATATDLNNQQVSGRNEAIVHKGTTYIGVRPNPRVVEAGQTIKIDVLTVDTKAITVPNTLVNLQMFEQKWYSVQEKGPDGRFTWTTKVESTPVANTRVTTDDSSKAIATFTPPRAGSYKVLATGKDARGNEVRSSTFIYASGVGQVYWPMDNNDRMELVADKVTYKPGESAKILIPSPFPKAKALVTIERGRIIDHKTIDIQSNSQIVEIPVEASYLPNVYVSVVLVRSEAEGNGKADFKVGYVELPVKADEKKLNITITPDKSQYQPRESVTYKIKTTDFQGKPVQAEMSLALADASVLSLADDRGRDMFDSFYGRRSMNVKTGQSLSRSLNKVDPAALGMGKGGGGETSQETRGYFPDVAYWNARVETDKNGEAAISVPLPDSLTTWRLTVRGTTVDTIVGTEQNEIVVAKKVMVRPVAPRFLITGDEARLEAIVHNYTTEAIETDVTLQAQGALVSGQTSQRVKIEPAGSVKVYWTVKAGKDREARFTFQAEPVSPSTAPKDAVEITLPTLTYSMPEITATSGEVRTTITEVVQLPAGIDREFGELTVKVEPSLASGMQDSLKYLEIFPYECVEQTVSRFLPNLATLRALNKVGIEKPELKEKLPALVSASVQRLNRSQNPDGSWGWWPGDTGNPFITAYALYGLSEAGYQGFTTDMQVINRAAGYLNGYLAKSKDAYSPENTNLRAYILYVLASAGKGDKGTTIALYERRDSLGRYGKAYLAMALWLSNNGQTDNRVQNLVEDLTGAAIVSATGAHWEETSYDYKSMNTNNRTTSIVLAALVRVDPGNALIPNTVRWLMVSRKEGRWETTQETAMAVIALSDYLAMSGELDPSYSYEVAVNSKVLGNGDVAKANVSKANTMAVEINDLLIEEGNKLRLTRYPSAGEQATKGKMYYSLYLRYFLPIQNIQARSEGIVVAREYLDANDRPLKEVKIGDTVKAKLTIIAPGDLSYVVIEDPLPAGAEAIDPALKTTGLTARTSNKDRWRFTHVDIRDEKIAFFATFLPRGTYEYTYLIRATTAGNYQALPASAAEMYFPEVWGRSAGTVFTVVP